MEKNLRNYAAAGVEVKRFTYMINAEITLCKPTKRQKFIIVEDNLGDRSLVWIACIENNAEVWRHSINHVVRITYTEPII